MWTLLAKTNTCDKIKKLSKTKKNNNMKCNKTTLLLFIKPEMDRKQVKTKLDS